MSDLAPLGIWKSWRSGEGRLPNYLVRGRGKSLEQVVQSLVNALWREHLPGVELGLAEELTNIPGATRPLRVISRLMPGHLGVTDVVFRAEGQDLFVKFHSNPRTLITVLKAGLYGLGFLVLYAFCMALYLFGTGAYDGWVMDYSQKYVANRYPDGSAPVFMKKIITKGYYEFSNDKLVKAIKAKAPPPDPKAKPGDKSGQDKGIAIGVISNPQEWYGGEAEQYYASVILGVIDERCADSCRYAFMKPNGLIVDTVHFTPEIGIPLVPEYKPSGTFMDFAAVRIKDPKQRELVNACIPQAITFHRPWTLFELFLSDPKLAIFNVGGPSAILAMLIGTGLYFIPMSFLRKPCKFLGWPTPDEFSNMVASRNTWVERVLSDVLLHEFGVQEGDRFAVSGQ